MNLLTVLAFTFLFAAADRICGGPRIIPRIKLGKLQFSIINDVWVPFAIIGAAWGLTQDILLSAGLGVAFALWRGPGWKDFGGDMYPRTADELKGTFLRHLLAVVFAVPLWAQCPPCALAVPVIFAIAATALARANAVLLDTTGRIHNASIEISRGAVLGLLIGLVVL